MSRLIDNAGKISHLPVSERPNNRTDKLLEMLVYNTAIIIDELREIKESKKNDK